VTKKKTDTISKMSKFEKSCSAILLFDILVLKIGKFEKRYKAVLFFDDLINIIGKFKKIYCAVYSERGSGPVILEICEEIQFSLVLQSNTTNLVDILNLLFKFHSV
jgi:hypothetical protein